MIIVVIFSLLTLFLAVFVGGFAGALIGFLGPFTYVFQMYTAVESEVLGRDLTYSPKVWLIVFAILLLSLVVHPVSQVIGSANIFTAFTVTFISLVIQGLSFTTTIIMTIVFLIIGALIGVNFAAKGENLCGNMGPGMSVASDIVGTILASVHMAILANFHSVLMGIYKITGSFHEIKDVTDKVEAFHDAGVRGNIIGIIAGLITLIIGILMTTNANRTPRKRITENT